MAVYDRGHAVDRNWSLALPLSILGVVTSVFLPSALLLKGNTHQHLVFSSLSRLQFLLFITVPLDDESLYAALLLLLTNMVLLTATILITCKLGIAIHGNCQYT